MKTCRVASCGEGETRNEGQGMREGGGLGINEWKKIFWKKIGFTIDFLFPYFYT